MEVPADGTINDVKFSWSVQKSSWVAMRVYPSSHSNPIFIYVDKKPILEKKSAEWCLAALNQCWKMKEPNIRKEDKKNAEIAYDAARNIYQKMISEN